MKNLDETCPVCGAKQVEGTDIIGMALVRYACGRVLTKAGSADGWRERTECPDASEFAIRMKAERDNLQHKLSSVRVALDVWKVGHPYLSDEVNQIIGNIEDALAAELGNTVLVVQGE